MAKKTRPRGPALERRTLGPLLARHPNVLKVLAKHGVVFCPGCFLTLFSPLRKAAAYHAVPNLESLLGDLRRAIK